MAHAHAHGFWVATIACLLAGEALAQPIDPAPRVARAEPVVTVLIAGSDRDVAVLEGALADPFRRLGVALRFEHVAQIDAGAVLKLLPEASPMLARLWFDLASPAHVPIYVTDGRHERIYTRDFPLARGLDDVAVEQLVYVARSSVDSMLSGVDIGVRRDEFAASLEPPQERAPLVARDTERLVPQPIRTTYPFSVSLEVQAMTQNLPSQGPGVGIGVARGHFAAGFSAYYRFPFEVRGQDLGAHVWRMGARLDTSTFVDLAERSRLAMMLGAGLDFSRVTPEQTGSADATALQGFWVPDAVIRGTVGLEARAHGAWTISPLLGVDLDLALVKYVLDRSGVREIVFVPNRFRPFVAAQVAWPL